MFGFAVRLFVGVVLTVAMAPDATAQSALVGFGWQVFDTRWNNAIFVEIAAGGLRTFARLADGSVAAWGGNGSAPGPCVVPSLPMGLTYVEVAAGWSHGVARRSDGSVVAWGDNSYGQCNVPPLPPGQVYVEVAAGSFHSLARRSDGSVIAWGEFYGQCNAVASAGQSFVEIAAGFASAWRDSAWLGIARINSLPAQRAGAAISLTYSQIAAATTRRRTTQRRPVIAWGHHGYGQCTVPLPAGDFAEVSAGQNHSVASERRQRRRVGLELRGPVQRAATAAGTGLCRDRRGCASHRRAPKRWLRGRVGLQRLRSIQGPVAARGSLCGGRGAEHALALTQMDRWLPGAET
jgi:hypothetical protein